MEECPVCYAHWSTGTRHSTEPKANKKHHQSYTWGNPDAETFWKTEDWEYGPDGADWHSRSTSRHSNAPQTPRDQSAGARKGKGRGKPKKGKAKGQNQGLENASPFLPQTGKGFTAWPAMDSSSFMPATASTASPFQLAQLDAGQQEMAAALRRAYPDPGKIPEDVQLLLDKADKEVSHLGLKNLHQAAKHMDRAKKQLKEVNDQKKAHRTMWFRHVTEGIKMWETQLDSYRRHQAALTDLATKAQAEVTSTSKVIQVLGAAGPSATPPPIPVPDAVDTVDVTEESANQEEEQLRTSLQTVLKACASSLGITPDATLTEMEIKLDGEEKEDEKHKKRQRSLEPFAASRS